MTLRLVSGLAILCIALWLAVPALGKSSANAEARAAAAAVKTIGTQTDGSRPDAETQARLSATALSEDAKSLPEGWRKTLQALAEVQSDSRPRFMAAALDELDADYAKRTCGTALADLAKVTTEQLVTRCKLKEKKLLPSQPTKTMSGAALLFSAALTEQLLKVHASSDAVTLARWVAHLGRSDENAPGFAKP